MQSLQLPHYVATLSLQDSNSAAASRSIARERHSISTLNTAALGICRDRATGGPLGRASNCFERRVSLADFFASEVGADIIHSAHRGDGYSDSGLARSGLFCNLSHGLCSNRAVLAQPFQHVCQLRIGGIFDPAPSLDVKDLGQCVRFRCRGSKSDQVACDGFVVIRDAVVRPRGVGVRMMPGIHRGKNRIAVLGFPRLGNLVFVIAGKPALRKLALDCFVRGVIRERPVIASGKWKRMVTRARNCSMR